MKTHAQFLAIHGKRGALGGVMDGQHAIQPPAHALVQADGADEQAAVDGLVKLVSSGFAE